MDPDHLGGLTWTGGRALAEYVADRPALVAGKRVLELGCGSALVALTCDALGAAATTATDLDRVPARVDRVFDVLGAAPLPACDVLLAADVMFTSELARALARRAAEAHRAGARAPVADSRAGVARRTYSTPRSPRASASTRRPSSTTSPGASGGSGATTQNGTRDFAPLKSFLDAVILQYGNISLTVGDARGALFEYSNYLMTPDTVLGLASGSKWPAATALMACFHEHGVSLDDPVRAHLPWWASDPADERSAVTLRHVLSMTTGMIVDSDCDLAYDDCDARKALGSAAFAAFSRCRGDLPACAKELYDALPPRPMYAPGAKFMYSSLSFQFAAGPWPSSARMMDRFVHAMLADGLVPAAVRREMETVQVSKVSQYSSTTAFWGPYCIGNWQECLYGQFDGPMPEQCARADRHGHPGCGGYWNFVDRRRSYYYNFLPSWTCDRSNAYCETGSPDDFGQGCPALYGAAATLKQRVSTFLDDIFGA
ncbi:beta-lactamase [Aureococcus anophagefferens]|nr:beta-lactamase [Aureococcus anophagefferens]